MFIRLTTGRDRGQAVDMRDEEAKVMLGDGRALKVDFSDLHWARKRLDLLEELPALELSSLAETELEGMRVQSRGGSPEMGGTVGVLASGGEISPPGLPPLTSKARHGAPSASGDRFKRSTR